MVSNFADCASQEQATETIDSICAMVKTYLEQHKASDVKDVPGALATTAQLLHGTLPPCLVVVEPSRMTGTCPTGVMFQLDPEVNGRLQNSIAQVCESWWRQSLPHRNELVPQTISYLLIRSIEALGTKSGTRRPNTHTHTHTQVHATQLPTPAPCSRRMLQARAALPHVSCASQTCSVCTKCARACSSST